MLLFYDIHQLSSWLFKYLIRFIKLGLKFDFNTISIRLSFIRQSNKYIFKIFWWDIFGSICRSPLNFINDSSCFQIFDQMKKLSLIIFLKVICRRNIFRGDIKHIIFNGSWWKLSQIIMVFFLELYQFYFLLFKTLIRWRNLSL